VESLEAFNIQHTLLEPLPSSTLHPTQYRATLCPHPCRLLTWHALTHPQGPLSGGAGSHDQIWIPGTMQCTTTVEVSLHNDLSQSNTPGLTTMCAGHSSDDLDEHMLSLCACTYHRGQGLLVDQLLASPQPGPDCWAGQETWREGPPCDLPLQHAHSQVAQGMQDVPLGTPCQLAAPDSVLLVKSLLRGGSRGLGCTQWEAPKAPGYHPGHQF
jgi:hypothetical protein